MSCHVFSYVICKYVAFPNVTLRACCLTWEVRYVTCTLLIHYLMWSLYDKDHEWTADKELHNCEDHFHFYITLRYVDYTTVCCAMLSQLTIYLVYYYVILRTCCLTLHYVTLRDLIAYHMSCYLKLYKAALFYLKSAMRRCTNLLYALLFHEYITVIAWVKELKSTSVKHVVSDIVCQGTSYWKNFGIFNVILLLLHLYYFFILLNMHYYL